MPWIRQVPPALLAAVALGVAGCSDGETSAASGGDSPAGAGSESPALSVAPDGRLLLSWVEPAAAGTALRFAMLESDRWTDAATAAAGDDWFVNWADIAAVRAGAGGSLAAHWRVKTPGGPYAYHVRVAASADGGATWSAPVPLHSDDSATEHGFVTLAPVGEGFVAVWLDGRETAGDHDGEGAMTLRSAQLAADGTVGNETLLDERTCDCCPTDAVMGEAAVVVAYRDRSASEVRDISVCRMDLATGRWSEPAPVHEDGWTIAGCPVNGPALAAAGPRVACAWFTMGPDGDEPQVLVALSVDDGRTFGSPLRIDLGDPVGRCDLAPAPDGGWLASWLESAGEDAQIRIRRITPGGKMDPSRVAGVTRNDRASGIPRLAATETGIRVAWTEPGEPSRVRVVRLP